MFINGCNALDRRGALHNNSLFVLIENPEYDTETVTKNETTTHGMELPLVRLEGAYDMKLGEDTSETNGHCRWARAFM